MSRGGWIIAWLAWCWAASGHAQAPRTVVWLSAASAERDPVADAQRMHRERALRLELQARDLLLLEGEPAAAPEPDVPATLASMEHSATVLLERSGAAAVLWLESDDANAVTWLMVKTRGAGAPVKTPMPYPADVIESQLFALAAASLLDQVLSTPEPAAKPPEPQPLELNPFIAPPAQTAAAAPPEAARVAPAAVPALPRKAIAPQSEHDMFVNVGIVLAFADLHSGMESSTIPDFEDVFTSYEDASGEMQYVYNDGSPFVPDADTVDEYGPISSACEADGTATEPGEPASKYCARVDDPGLIFVPALRFALGFWLRPDISLAAVYQMHYTTNPHRPFGNQSLGAELQYLVVGDRWQGFGASLTGSAFIGRYETPADSGDGSQVNALSGPLGITAGYTMRYTVQPQLAFVFGQHAGLRFPDFQVEIDVFLMSEVSF